MAVAPMVDEEICSKCRGFFAVFVIYYGKKKGKFRSFSPIGSNLGFSLIFVTLLGACGGWIGSQPTDCTHSRTGSGATGLWGERARQGLALPLCLAGGDTGMTSYRVRSEKAFQQPARMPVQRRGVFYA